MAHAPSTGKVGPMVPLGIAAVLLLIVGFFAWQQWGRPAKPKEMVQVSQTHRPSVSDAVRTNVQTARTTRTYQKPVGTECEPFNTSGSTCEIGTEGSDWTRIDPNAPDGKYVCWSPGGRNLFTEVWYINRNGQQKRYDFDNPPGAEEKPSAYRWVPVEKLRMTYGVQDAPCSYPS